MNRCWSPECGTLIKRTRFTSPLALRCIHVPLVAKNFWLALSAHHSAAKERRFSTSLSLLFSYDLKKKKDPDRFLCPHVELQRVWMWRRSSLLKTQLYALAERKPDKSEKFRLTRIWSLISAIPEIKIEKKVNTKIKELANIIKHYIRCNGKYYKQKLDWVFLSKDIKQSREWSSQD